MLSIRNLQGSALCNLYYVKYSSGYFQPALVIGFDADGLLEMVLNAKTYYPTTLEFKRAIRFPNVVGPLARWSESRFKNNLKTNARARI